MASKVVSRKGYRDFIIQRLSAVYMVLYVVFALAMLIIYEERGFELMQTLFMLMPVRILTFFFIVSMLMHSWVGMWTIATDYINNAFFRNLYFMSVAGALLFYLIWAVEIIWDLT